MLTLDSFAVTGLFWAPASYLYESPQKYAKVRKNRAGRCDSCGYVAWSNSTATVKTNRAGVIPNSS